MTESMICHDQFSPWFNRITNFVDYRNISECLNDGGRLPRTEQVRVDEVVGSRVPTAYSRDAFGEGWADVDRDCQNTRAEVLASMSTQAVTWRGDRGCTVDRGKWISLFTNSVFYEASKLDVDHVFPLALAWERGAYSWPYIMRVEFANDPMNLWPVEARLNRSKDAKPISEWLPPSNQCEYAYRYIRVAKTYGLHITRDDELVLNSCKSGFQESEGSMLLDLGIFKIRGNFNSRLGTDE